MRNLLIILGLAVLAVQAGSAQDYADMVVAPAVTSKAELEAQLNPLPKSTLAKYMERIGRTNTYAEMEGQNAFLQQYAEAEKNFMVGAGYPVDQGSEDLFGEGFVDGAYTVHQAAITSIDAYALRLHVDLSQLQDGEEVWVVDLTGPRAFGPFTAADNTDDGRWLPTTEGESCVLMVRSATGSLPEVRLIEFSHFFRSFEQTLKALSCNNNINCDSTTAVQTASTGVGMIVIPSGSGDSALCTGSLINNADTAALEPYFLTSAHCVPETASASGVDIVWDWRSTSCANYTPPSLSGMPRSNGVKMLASSGTYDLTLMQLDTVPSGTNGRAYLGWDVRDPIVNEPIIAIHFPAGTAQRISYGTVVSIDQTFDSYQNETKVHWDDGVTEGGSSGSPLLFVNSSYRITGTLSGGPTHSCSNTTGNVDWYTSLRDFYSQIQDYLTGTTPPDPGSDPSTGCAAAKAFVDNPQVLQDLRALRDEALVKTSWGKSLVDAYYANSPKVATAVDESPSARTAFRLMAAPFAALGGLLSR
ncbi:MAG: serine protease [Candidatus Hydrogenedentes bacterium]|nr:serine protease [Candidatus Hydrogenedentota bacterium]